MATTLGQIINTLEEQRKATPQKSPIADSLNRLVDVMSVMRNGINSLDESIKEQRASQGAARNLAQADDVKEKIRTLLELKVSEDKIEQERHQRMMDVAESVVPQITDEQLDTIREQRKAYREQQWALKEELRIAEETAKVQKESSQAIADAEKSVIQDKYGTISGAVSGLESKAQDPLSRMLMQGIGRLVKEKEEDKAKAIVKAQSDRDRISDRDVAWKKEDIQEDATIAAYRAGIKDPGSAVSLLKQRDRQVTALAKEGESLEGGVASGTVTKGRNPKKPSGQGRADVPTTEVPIVQRVQVEEVVPTIQETVPIVQPTAEPQPAPKNARFRKSETQTTGLVTPSKERTTEPTESRGLFGSKAGFADFGGIGKLVGGIVGPLKSLAGSFLKFMGPWGLVANALMSFDRLVPIISTGAGALMDLSKLVMPMTVTALLEGFSGLLQAVDGIAEFLQKKLFGTGMTDETSYQNARNFYDRKEQEQFEKEQRQKKAITAKDTSAVNTTSARRHSIGGVSIIKRETLLTTPTEEDTIRNRVKAEQTVSPNQLNTTDVQAQREQTEAFKEAVLAAAKNPGTTVMWGMNPSILPWPV